MFTLKKEIIKLMTLGRTVRFPNSFNIFVVTEQEAAHLGIRIK